MEFAEAFFVAHVSVENSQAQRNGKLPDEQAEDPPEAELDEIDSLL